MSWGKWFKKSSFYEAENPHNADDIEAGSSGGGATLLRSPDNTLWLVTVTDSGVLQTQQVATGTPGTLHLFSPDNTEWNITITNAGALKTTEV